jgi:hypothetical protein
MGISGFSTSDVRNVGANLLSLNYYTLVVVDSARDSVYTLGIDSLGLFPDSAGIKHLAGWAGLDTTCLYLDGFVSETLNVNMFVSQTAACTLFVTVEQSLRYNKTLADSGFNYGFVTTDTLFKSRMNTTFDTLIIATAGTLPGVPARIYTDKFLLKYPCLRLKVLHMANIAGDKSPALLFELQARHNNTIMSGTSGRLQQQMP